MSAKVVLDDYTFKRKLEKVRGTLVADYGLVSFYCEERGLIKPLSFFVPAELFDTEQEAFIWSGTDDLIFDLGKDDVLMEDAVEGDLDVFESFDEISDLFYMKKFESIKNVMLYFYTALIFLVLGVLSILAVFVLKLLPLIYFLVPVGVLTFICIVFMYKLYELNDSIVYDSKDNWINIDTRESSLNGGMKIRY